MKKYFLVTYLIYLGNISIYGQHVYTVKNGAWEDSSTWYNQIRPKTSGDSIYIYNHLSFHSDITLGNCYVDIDSSGGLCGNYKMTLNSNTSIYNTGFLGVYGLSLFESYVENDSTGYIDCGELSLNINDGGSYYNDAGCTWGHYGPEACLCYNDSNLENYISNTLGDRIINNDIYFQMDSDLPSEYYFNFGDGTSDTADGYQTGYNLVHVHADTGYYPLQIIISGCCFNDTITTLVHIDSVPPPPPPPPPPCEDTFPFRCGPSPANHNFAISWQFCNDEVVTVKLYSLNGQLVFEQVYNTVSKELNQSIDTYFLPAACYILSVEGGNRKQRKMIAVIHDY